MCIVISIGKWGNVYWYRGFGFRLCLGWVAITFLPVDGDFILEQAAEQVNAGENLAGPQYDVSGTINLKSNSGTSG